MSVLLHVMVVVSNSGLLERYFGYRAGANPCSACNVDCALLTAEVKETEAEDEGRLSRQPRYMQILCNCDVHRCTGNLLCRV